MRPLRRLALFGLGRHARRIYYPMLSEECRSGPLELVAVVDRAERRECTEAFLKDQEVKPLKVLYSEKRDGMDSGLRAALEALEIDGVVLSTDPLAHKDYLLWALARGLDVLMDKPITAPLGVNSPGRVAEALAADFAEIESALAGSSSNCVVMCQRRAHPGYQTVAERVEEVRRSHGMEITSLDISHEDGMWVMPEEWDRDYHPYKHGTGKLLHSGYHFLDLATYLLPKHESACLEFGVLKISPDDAMAQQKKLYEKLAIPTEVPADLRHLGELDLNLLGRLRKDQCCLCSLNLSLRQNTFSRRGSNARPSDPYKGAGRIRHERLSLQMGPLMNIQVHSYQSHELRDPDPQREYGPGHRLHFEVQVFRNSAVIGGPPFERLDFGSGSAPLGHNEESRRSILRAFLGGRPSLSPFSQQRPTHALLVAIYRALEEQGEQPMGLGRVAWCPTLLFERGAEFQKQE